MQKPDGSSLKRSKAVPHVGGEGVSLECEVRLLVYHTLHMLHGYSDTYRLTTQLVSYLLLLCIQKGLED